MNLKKLVAAASLATLAADDEQFLVKSFRFIHRRPPSPGALVTVGARIVQAVGGGRGSVQNARFFLP